MYNLLVGNRIVYTGGCQKVRDMQRAIQVSGGKATVEKVPTGWNVQAELDLIDDMAAHKEAEQHAYIVEDYDDAMRSSSY